MLVSDYIAVLEQVKKEHGDLHCLAYNQANGHWSYPLADVQDDFDLALEEDDLGDVEPPRLPFVIIG